MVIWTEPARNDLKAIYEYIALDSRFYARNTVRNIVERASRLSTVPEIGRIVPEVNAKSIREVFMYSYRVIYQIYLKKVYILAIVHGHRIINGDEIPVIE